MRCWRLLDMTSFFSLFSSFLRHFSPRLVEFSGRFWPFFSLCLSLISPPPPRPLLLTWNMYVAGYLQLRFWIVRVLILKRPLGVWSCMYQKDIIYIFFLLMNSVLLFANCTYTKWFVQVIKPFSAANYSSLFLLAFLIVLKWSSPFVFLLLLRLFFFHEGDYYAPFTLRSWMQQIWKRCLMVDGNNF